mmetsp:Transcript_9772/g.44511  ORF Transcript_9772/g.44511 Transcript_9772/m.44511 type:complete len:245 (+) Transcript_9772:1834-2568(+)
MIMHGSLPLGHRRRPNLILGIRPVLRAMVQPVLIQMARSEKVPAPVATTALAPVSLDWTMILDRPPHATAPATQQTLPTRATRGLTHLDVASCWITTRLFPKRRVAAVELDAASCLKNAAIHMVIHVVDGVTLNLIPIVSRSFVVSRRTAGTAAAAATAEAARWCSPSRRRASALKPPSLRTSSTWSRSWRFQPRPDPTRSSRLGWSTPGISPAGCPTNPSGSRRPWRARGRGRIYAPRDAGHR